MRKLVLGLVAAAGSVACSGGSHPDGGNPVGPLPIVLSVTPSTGPVDGGTIVSVLGFNFQNGAQLFLGAQAAGNVQVISADRLIGTTPPASIGPVDVRVVNPDQGAGAFAGGYSYFSPSQFTIADAVLYLPAFSNGSGTGATVSVPATADVMIPGLTGNTTQAPGVVAQVGWALADAGAFSAFTWATAMYGGLGADGGDHYSGSMTVPAASGSEIIPYFVTLRFTVDGVDWTYAGRDGAWDGGDFSDIAVVNVTGPVVGFCKVGPDAPGAPPVVVLQPGQPGPVELGQVWAAGVTDKTGQGSGIIGQLGYGDPNADPSTWTWIDAAYDQDIHNGSNDQYKATLPNPGPGVYGFAYRFQLNNGPWTYCDGAPGGSTGGWQAAYAGSLTVGSSCGGAYCRVSAVSSSSPGSGMPIQATGLVHITGITDRGVDPGALVQVGIGNHGDNASLGGSWAWQNATYQSMTSAGEAQYGVNTFPAYSGARDLAFRYSADGGPSWCYCNSVGQTDGGYDPSTQWNLNVGNTTFDYCVLQYPPALDAGTASVYGQFYQHGVTTPDAGDPVIAQLGYGPWQEDPGVSTNWAWRSAPYNMGHTGANDEYLATLSGAHGTYSYTYRFTVDGGSWCYGGLFPNGSTPSQGFTPGASGANLGIAVLP